MPKCQNVKIPKCQNVKMSKCQHAKCLRSDKSWDLIPSRARTCLKLSSVPSIIPLFPYLSFAYRVLTEFLRAAFGSPQTQIFQIISPRNKNSRHLNQNRIRNVSQNQESLGASIDLKLEFLFWIFNVFRVPHQEKQNQEKQCQRGPEVTNTCGKIIKMLHTVVSSWRGRLSPQAS